MRPSLLRITACDGGEYSKPHGTPLGGSEKEDTSEHHVGGTETGESQTFGNTESPTYADDVPGARSQLHVAEIDGAYRWKTSITPA